MHGRASATLWKEAIDGTKIIQWSSSSQEIDWSKLWTRALWSSKTKRSSNRKAPSGIQE